MQMMIAQLADETERASFDSQRRAMGVFIPDDDEPWYADLP